MEWCRAYQHDSLHGLVDKRAGGNCAKLAPLQIEDLAQRLHDYTPRDLFGAAACSMSGQSWTVDDLQVSVRRWYDVEYRSLTSYLQLLAVCEFSYQQTEKVYKSHSQRKVADFEEQLEKKLIDQAQTTPDTIFLAEDEAGLYLQATAAAVWSPVGQTPCVRVDPGRAQTHFYGTLNLVTGQELVLRSDVMNAQVSARYLEQILKTYPKHPIVLL